VIHTVGPVWRGGKLDEPDLLASCYRRSLEVAVQHGIGSIAFPAISCGAYGYPLELAVPIAVDTVRGFARLSALERVLFACASAEALRAYQAELGA
jgi:O-acetyl-ADP-ribose deacetylase (regulator of RNase III)